ncbi:hypothetical protein, partial [Soonwooa buanensis]|uniref:hypothetical protein n=1 Tax=Soonwooa buanensis TaxID=619805 RepID=UPI001C87044F
LNFWSTYFRTMHFLTYQLTEKVLAKCGLSKNWKFKNGQTKPMLFLGTKLQKNVESKSSGG